MGHQKQLCGSGTVSQSLPYQSLISVCDIQHCSRGDCYDLLISDLDLNIFAFVQVGHNVMILLMPETSH